MSKFVGLLSFLCSSVLFGQITAVIESWNTGYVDVTSYNGLTANNQIVNFIKVQNSQQFDLQKWSMSAKVISPITNGHTTFPPDKLSFRFNHLVNDGTANGITPTPSNINLKTGLIPFGVMGEYFVLKSPFSLNVVNYLGIKFHYDVIVEPGAYMTPHSNWDNFRVNLMVELHNNNGTVISSHPVSFYMRIRPTDTPPQTPSYGMSFDANAKNVLLEFNTANDYANGLSKTQSKAFSTFSKTGYVVRVNTLNSNLVSSTNKTLPVSAVKLTVKDNQSQTVTGNVTLSTAQQNVISSTAHTATKFFDTIYSTQPGDPTFFNKSPEQYSGTLIYTMIPQ